MGRQPLLRMALTLATAVAGLVTVFTVSAPTAAYADACYTWNRTLSQGMTGDDVKQLQIRVAGYPGTRSHLALDGSYGPATKAAVTRFQQAYGLPANGVAGTATFNKLYQLQKDDCTPLHFDYAELDDDCVGGWSGGRISAARTKQNALHTMWKLEALRHAMGDKPLTVTTAFRNVSCNASVGGSSNSQHLYGNGADLVSSYFTLCQIASAARNHGFSGLLGPGYPNHNDHIHVDSRVENEDDGLANAFLWSAPNCGIS